jgi:hypothetical protein
MEEETIVLYASKELSTAYLNYKYNQKRRKNENLKCN